jgi:alpha-L-rhamnosidase
VQSKNPTAVWIWYPGEFEIWLREVVELRREERGAVPVMWKLDRFDTAARFRKVVELEETEEITIYTECSLHVLLNGHPYGSQRKLTLMPGKHELLLTVTNRHSPPALYVQGDRVVSDHTWEANLLGSRWSAVGLAAFQDPLAPPSTFRLATRPLDPANVELLEDGSLLADFGKETFGYLRLHGVTGRGNVRFDYGESLHEAMDAERCEIYDVVSLDATVGKVEFLHDKSRAFRYIHIQPEASLYIGQVSMLYEYLPVEKRGSFTSSDELVNEIWLVSDYTFHLNTREFFLDGIKRDRWLWSGDAYQSALMNYYHFYELEVTKRTLLALRGKDPVEQHLNTILDYSFYWIMGMYDYYLYTGDDRFIRNGYERMEGLMQFCIGRTNSRGYVEGLPGDWVFIDWADLDNRGEVSTEQLLLARSLEVMGKVSELTGRREAAEKYAGQFHTLRDRILLDFWDHERGGLIHHRLEGVPQAQLTKHANMFALLFGYLSPSRKNEIKNRVLLNPEIAKIKTPYMRFYELDALCELHEHEYVMEEIKVYWGGMLKLGATSFWEEYDPTLSGEEHLAMYGRPYGKSLCHAWGATPLYILGKHFLGVTPAAPGYTEFVVSPHLGGLDWIEGKVPTPIGDIFVRMDQQTIVVRFESGIGILRFSCPVEPQVNRGSLRPLGKSYYELSMEWPGEYRVLFIEEPVDH